MGKTKGLGRRALRVARGFSLIEVLVAAALMLMVALGVLPLFTRSMSNNLQGNDYMQVTNIAKSELERLYELPFSSPDLAVEGTERVRVQHLKSGSDVWEDGAGPASPPPQWRRTSTVRQFSLAGLVDGNDDGYFDSPLPAGTADTFIHVKEISILAEGGRTGGPLGVGKRVLLRTLKPF
jgi:prepilin-type N-terminal cleavage/methylation domain-containing protein